MTVALALLSQGAIIQTAIPPTSFPAHNTHALIRGMTPSKDIYDDPLAQKDWHKRFVKRIAAMEGYHSDFSVEKIAGILFGISDAIHHFETLGYKLSIKVTGLTVYYHLQIANSSGLQYSCTHTFDHKNAADLLPAVREIFSNSDIICMMKEGVYACEMLGDERAPLL